MISLVPARLIVGLGPYNDLDQSSLSFPTYWRDKERMGHPVATEHTVYSSTDKLYEVAQQRGLTDIDDEGQAWDEDFVSWEFKDEAEIDERGNLNEISFDFWSGYQQYSVEWRYERENNRFLRLNGGQAFKDLNTDGQIEAKTVVVQFVKEQGPVDVNKHLLYTTTGTGKAIVFQDGQAIVAAWSKNEQESRTVFKDSKGKPIEFNRGPVWIEIVPAGNEVDY
jgi:hypothetical protein